MTDVLSINFLQTQVSHSPDPRQRRDFVKRLGNIEETFELPQSERRHAEETSYPFSCSELESNRCTRVTALFLIDGQIFQVILFCFHVSKLANLDLCPLSPIASVLLFNSCLILILIVSNFCSSIIYTFDDSELYMMRIFQMLRVIFGVLFLLCSFKCWIVSSVYFLQFACSAIIQKINLE